MTKKAREDYMNAPNNILGHLVSDLPKMHRGDFSFSPIFKSNEFIGAEFELEGFNLPGSDKIKSIWTAKSDGSLRCVDEHGNYINPDIPEAHKYTPWEYVLKRPVSPDVFKTKAFPHLLTKLKENEAKPCFSVRTSVHIHLGVHELRMYQVYALIAMYLVIEDMLVSLTGEERDGNLFCLNSSNSEYLADILLETILNKNGIPYASPHIKYSSVNFLTLYNLGTVEFRAMEGTLDQDRIFSWIDILVALRTWASKLLPHEIGMMMNIVSLSGPSDFLASIMGGWDSPAFKALLKGSDSSLSTMNRLMYNGISRAQSIAYEPDWSSLKNKEFVAPPEETPVKFKKKLYSLEPMHWSQTVSINTASPSVLISDEGEDF